MAFADAKMACTALGIKAQTDVRGLHLHIRQDLQAIVDLTSSEPERTLNLFENDTVSQRVDGTALNVMTIFGVLRPPCHRRRQICRRHGE